MQSDTTNIDTMIASLSDRQRREFALWCAERVRHLMTDPRSTAALDVTARHLRGEATDEELAAAQDAATAARTAAWDAAAAGAASRAAAGAAGAASWAAGAAGAASWAAATAARDATWDAELAAQRAELERVLAEVKS
jgi:hypothetical protein